MIQKAEQFAMDEKPNLPPLTLVACGQWYNRALQVEKAMVGENARETSPNDAMECSALGVHRINPQFAAPRSIEMLCGSIHVYSETPKMPVSDDGNARCAESEMSAAGVGMVMVRDQGWELRRVTAHVETSAGHPDCEQSCDLSLYVGDIAVLVEPRRDSSSRMGL